MPVLDVELADDLPAIAVRETLRAKVSDLRPNSPTIGQNPGAIAQQKVGLKDHPDVGVLYVHVRRTSRDARQHATELAMLPHVTSERDEERELFLGWAKAEVFRSSEVVEAGRHFSPVCSLKVCGAAACMPYGIAICIPRALLL